MRAHQVPFRILYGAHRSAVLRPYERAGFGDVHAQMVYFDAAVIESLAGRRGVTLHDFRAYLEGYLGSQLGLRPGHLLLEDYAHFKRFYFDHNPDPERLARLQAALRAAGVPANRL
jgi:hypothetical protein